MSENLKIKRVYEDASKKDGYRILVDRIWPRGVSKEEAKLDKWWKEIAPSDDTRKTFDHEPDKFDEFKNNYFNELDQNEETEHFIQLVDKELDKGTVTLLYGAKDKKYNQAVVLKEYIEKNREADSSSHSKEFYQRIGRKGGEETAKTHDKEFYQKIGRKGSQASQDE